MAKKQLHNFPPSIKIKSAEQIKTALRQIAKNADDSKVDTGQVILEEKTQVDKYKDKTAKQVYKRLKAENLARRSFGENIFTLTVIWFFLVLAVVFHCGTGNLKLSDSVIIALITTTTANVFGFLYVVVNYLFNKDKAP